MKRLALFIALGTGLVFASLPAWTPPSYLTSMTSVLEPLQAARASVEPLFAGLEEVVQRTLSGNQPDALAFRTRAAERGELVETVQAAGTLNALVLVEVGSQISGQVKELYADFNSSV